MRRILHSPGEHRTLEAPEPCSSLTRSKTRAEASALLHSQRQRPGPSGQVSAKLWAALRTATPGRTACLWGWCRPVPPLCQCPLLTHPPSCCPGPGVACPVCGRRAPGKASGQSQRLGPCQPKQGRGNPERMTSRRQKTMQCTRQSHICRGRLTAPRRRD